MARSRSIFKISLLAAVACLALSAGAFADGVSPGNSGSGSSTPSYVSGNVGGYDKVIPSTPTVSTSAYSANEAMGGWQNVAVFRSTSQPSGLLDAIQVNSKGGMTAGLNIWAFRRLSANLSSTCTDSAAFVLSSADLPYLIPGFPITISSLSAANGATQTTGPYPFTPPISVNNADPTASLNFAFCAVTNGTPTLGSASDLVFNYGIVQD